MPYNKTKIKVQVPNMSGHNLSHRNSGTLKVGQLTPLLTEEVIPGTRISLNIPESVQLPPLASETFMNLKLKHEAFFIPFRLLSASYEDWFIDQKTKRAQFGPNGNMVELDCTPMMPSVTIDLESHKGTAMAKKFGPGSLFDYLGGRVDTKNNKSQTLGLAPFIAYHLLWDTWYRNTYVQKPGFIRPAENGLSFNQQAFTPHNPRIASLPYLYYCIQEANAMQKENMYNFTFDNSNSGAGWKLADGHFLFEMRQRNFGFDLFTSCRPSPQAGQPAGLELTVDDEKTGFTIAQLRAANSLQQFRERNNIPGARYVDQLLGRYGVRPSDGVAQRPILLGSNTMDVFTRGIDQTASADGKNPFSGVAAQYGRAQANGVINLIDDYTVQEHGLIMVIQSLVPEVTYGSGIAPYLTRYLNEGSIVELANPLLQNVGDEAIPAQFLSADFSDEKRRNIFGYNDRYCTFMFHPNEVHGELRDGQTLDSFVLQRTTDPDANVELSSEFLQIPQNYLDQVLAVGADASNGVSAWYDAMVNLRIANCLGEYSLPSLQDPAYEHGHTIELNRGGQLI